MIRTTGQTTVCRICGGPTITGMRDCPACQNAAEKRRIDISHGETRPYWNNASHAGKPSGFRIVGGAYHGMNVEVVLDR